ncbi:hypothetical protein ROZALSC1DRAFT_24587 [Rozella allomycis CSF55]|uniref:Uncharacterized protein n=2 Tax=Rozella allomycis (strain CSF55) TaxID=988480 RepID=A0A4P9YD00_ROZAC|nr:hypothetical protein ROZALSC1DRAFT_24587 [Rozella allomycis CSF55]
MSLKRDSLSLYRKWLRLCRFYPVENLIPKMRFNVREAMNIYRDIDDDAKREAIDKGYQDYYFMQKLLKVDKSLLKRLFLTSPKDLEEPIEKIKPTKAMEFNEMPITLNFKDMENEVNEDSNARDKV